MLSAEAKIGGSLGPVAGAPDLLEGLTWYCVRRRGEALREGWLRSTALWKLRERSGAGPEETVEACIVTASRTVETRDARRTFTRAAQGVLGAEVTFRGETARLAPLRTVTTNRRFETALEGPLPGSGGRTGGDPRKRTDQVLHRGADSAGAGRGHAGREAHARRDAGRADTRAR